MTRRWVGTGWLVIALSLAGWAQTTGDARPAQEAAKTANTANNTDRKAQEVPELTGVALEVAAMPPAAAYAWSLEPVDVVRKAPENMTPAEHYAWSVAVARAGKQCAVRNMDIISGEELFTYARLCTLGQAYDVAIKAVRRYLDIPGAQNRDLAFALWARTALQISDGDQAHRVTEKLLQQFPYDAVVHSVSQEVFMALAGPGEPNAMAIGLLRLPLLMKAVGTGKPLKSTRGDFEIPVATLFRDGMKVAALYRHRGDTAESDYILQSLAGKLQDVSSQIEPLQHHAIDMTVKRFLMLTQPAPQIDVWKQPAVVRAAKTSAKSKQPEPQLASLNATDKVTVLLFFTSWCPQCLKAAPELAKLPSTYNGMVQAFAVTTPDVFGPDTMSVADIRKAAATELKDPLKDVPFMVIDDASRTRLLVEEYPTVAVLDQHGAIRYLDELPRDQFQENGYLDHLIRRCIGPTRVSTGK